MDGERFDDLIRRIGTTRLTRMGALRGVITGVAAALAGETLATDESQAKGKGKKRHRNAGGKSRGHGGKKGKGGASRPRVRAASVGGSACNPSQFPLCHCVPPDEPNKCNIQCVAGDEGHQGHPFDCACGAPVGTVPECEDACASILSNAACCPICPSDQPDCCFGVDDKGDPFGFCTNLDTDEANCGECGDACRQQACRTAPVCQGGSCTSDPDPSQNGDSCNGGAGICCNGTCDTQIECCTDDDCAAGETCCSGTCKNLNDDEDNCGACGEVCPQPECRTAVCSGGVCGSEADAGQDNEPCGDGDICCSGECVSNDTLEVCGTCGTSCPPAAVCKKAVCRNETCGEVPDSDQNNQPCGDGDICCDGKCVNNDTVEVCGTCGTSCPPAAECNKAVCNKETCDEVPDESLNNTACGPNGANICCSGECVDNDTLEVCGTCGNTCPPAAVCKMAVCTDETCGEVPDSGQNDEPCGDGDICCGGDCVSNDTLQNCGTCGNVCPAAPICKKAVCDNETCGAVADPTQNGNGCLTPSGGSGLCCGGQCIDCPDDTRLTANCTCSPDCTLTQGYWKTHSRKGPAPYDNSWKNLGDADKDGKLEQESETFFKSGKTWYEVLWTTPNGNPYYILAHQYIAAVLNGFNGADTSAVSAVLTKATAFFTTFKPTDKLTAAKKAEVLGWATTLDQFNNGVIGPGHCDGAVITRAASGTSAATNNREGKRRRKGGKTHNG